MGHRMSSLPISRYCGHAPVLGAKGSSGRPAMMGRAFHASCAGEPDASALLARLTDKEAEEIAQWHRPADVTVGDTVLRYEDAQKEVEVALDADGMYTPDASKALTIGHVDFVWVVTLPDGTRCAFVADIKRSSWTVSDGAASLQLSAYGYACATKYECDFFVVGIWAATEGEWIWADAMVDMFSEGPGVWDLIRFAATTPDEAITGTHCTGCWDRSRCHAHLLPAQFAADNPDSALAQFAEGGAGITSQDDARRALGLVSAMKAIVEVAEGAMKNWARREGGILSTDGEKRYLPVLTRGRVSLNRSALEGDHPGLLKQYEKRGPDFETYRWLNANPKKKKAKKS